MSNNTNANAAPAANVKPDTKAGPVKLESNDPKLTAIADALFKATAEDAAARDNATAAITAASANSWGIMRDVVVKAIKEVGHGNADTALDLYLLQAKAAGGMVKQRSSQYAANLRRAVKAAAKGKELPADLLEAGRSAWNDHAFWSQSGVLHKTGTKAGSGKTATSTTTKAATNGEPEGGKPASVAGAIEGTKEARQLQGIADKLNALKGQFRATALSRIHETLDQQLKLQGAATGTAAPVAATA